MLETGKICKWEDIELNEVFSWQYCTDGTWVIEIKTAKSLFPSGIILTDEKEGMGCRENGCWGSSAIVFKLPLRIQRYWKEV